MKESTFQKIFLDKVRELVPGCIAMKNDAQYIQGIYDWTIQKGSKAAALEIKKSKDAPHRPNQDYYINKINEQGGFGRFVYPENEKQVLEDIVNFFNN